MIDTITIRTEDFVLYSDEHFTKAKYQELRGKYGMFGKHGTRYTTYPSACKKRGEYFPQVHIAERSRRKPQGMVPTSRHLVIQVSLPKLLYGTNLFDVDERLLQTAVIKLSERLREISVGISPVQLLDATVVRVDYSKVLRISESYRGACSILHVLAKYDLKRSSDFNKIEFRNGRNGFYLKFFNSSQGLVIYDKFEEIVSNGTTNLEREIARAYRSGKWKKGALRIELSLQKKQTVEAKLRPFFNGKTKDFTLAESVDTRISQACLLKAFEDTYVKGFNGLVRLAGLKDAKLRRTVDTHTKNLKERAILYYLTRHTKTHGPKATTALLRAEYSPSTVQRYKRLTERVLEASRASKDTSDAVSYLHKQLLKYRPVLPKGIEDVLRVADRSNDV